MHEEANQREVVQLCQHLIQAPSLSGQEKEVIDRLTSYFSSKGIKHLTVDDYGSLIARIPGKRPGPTLLFDGHVDTVPVPDPQAWTHSPFEGQIDQGRLYGRGASDMKGAVSAMAVAAAHFLQESQGDFAGTLVIAGVVQEEVFEGVAARSISKACQPDLVIIGEATELKLNIGQRGRAEINLETFGVPAHSANPEKGVNAVYLMMDAIRQMTTIIPPQDAYLGPGILELTDIKSSPYPGASVVPSHCLVTYDRRLLPGETEVSVMESLCQALENLDLPDPRASLQASFALGKETCYTGQVMEAERFFPGWRFDQDQWFVTQAQEGLQRAGFSAPFSHYNFCTNGSHYAGEAGTPTLGFGPSLESLAHTIDEYIEIEQLLTAKEGYQAIMEVFLK